MDLAKDSSHVPDLLRHQDQVLWTGGRRGAPVARNLGVQAARGNIVAFLDDDDEWLPKKLEQQLKIARTIETSGRLPVVATQHIQVEGSSGRSSGPVPIKVFEGEAAVSEFLFRRRRPGGGRASMYTSTLMVSRAAAVRVPWDESLKRHQDWDWLIRLDGEDDVRVAQAPWVGTLVHSGSVGSLSASSDWQTSLAWADNILPAEPKGVYEDFLTAQTARYAIAARSFNGVRSVVRRLLSRRRLPAVGPVLIALAAIMPRSVLERLMTRIR